MSDDPVSLKVRGAFREVMGPAADDGAALRLGVHPKWDSLAHMDLILAVEKATGVRFQTFEIPTLDTFDAVLAAVRARQA